MDMERRITRLRAGLLRRIAAAAQKGDGRTVIELNLRLQQVERLNGQLHELKRELEALEDGGERVGQPWAVSHPSTGEVAGEGNAWRSSGKERGVNRRREFIESLPPAARPDDSVAGAVFVAPKLNKLRIGVAYAHEGTRTNRWFLGLHEKRFDHAVLLCEGKSGKVTHFSLPKEFMAQIRPSLARKNDQLKFNVLKKGSEYFLLAKPGRHIRLEPFRDNFQGLH